MQTEIDKIDKEIDAKREVLNDLYKKRTQLILGDLKQKIMNQFIEFKRCSSDNPTYMKVYEVFRCRENQVLIRGCGFYSEWTPYWDACGFRWDRAIDEYLSDDYIDTAIEKGKIKIITKEEFVSKFNEAKEKLDEYFNQQLDQEYSIED